MTARAGALLIAAALACPLGAGAAQAQTAAEKFVQGAWHHSGTVPGSVPGREMSFFIEWRFAQGRFVQTGYPPLHSEGRYRVLYADPTVLKLLLFEQSGNFSERDRTIEIALDPKAQTISVNRGPSLRRKPVSN
jgi:hypothetical protein